jgi:hypothetical protein
VAAEFKQWTDLEGSVHAITNGTALVGRKPILLEEVSKKTH